MKVYEAGTRTFENNGLGHIEPLKCIETKKKSLNGWELDCEVSVEYRDMISKDRIVLVDTKESGAQPFFIEAPEITGNHISFTARHVAFLSERYVLDDVRPTELIGIDFLNYIAQRTDESCPFSFYSNVSDRKTKYFIRKNLLEALEEAEELFGAVFVLDGYKINMLTTIDKLSDQTLVYGKNMTGIKVYEDWDTVTTKILPVGPDELMLPEKYLSAEDVRYPEPYTRVVSFELQKEKEDGSQKSNDELIVELRSLAIDYLNKNMYPKVNYVVSADVPQTLSIGDVVPVKHPLVTIETSVQEYKYNVLLKKVESIVYGNYERNVQKLFDEIKSDITKVDKKADDFLVQAQKEVQYLMNIAGKNGSMTFRKNDKGVVYEILCMDTNDIETAKTILRINAQGIAGTTEGIHGNFKSAMMSNGMVVAEMIAAGTLKAMNIEGSIISGGEINGTTITTDKNIIVGNNIEMNVQELNTIKKIAFNKNSRISCYKANDGEMSITLYSDSISMMPTKNFSIDSNNLNYGLLITDNSFSLKGGGKTVIYVNKDLTTIEANTLIGSYVSGQQKNLTVTGDLLVRGKKNRIVDTTKGKIKMNAVESTYAVFEDFGESKTDEKGIAVVKIDNLFKDTVSVDKGYFVALQEYGEGKVFVDSRNKDAFIVRGTPNLKFAWRITAKQKGYEDIRMEVLN